MRTGDIWDCGVDFKRRTNTLVWGVLAAWHNVELFTIPPTLRDSFSAGLLECLEHGKCSLVLPVSTHPFLVYHRNVLIDDHTGETAVWRVAALEFFILALLLFPVVVQSGAVVYDCLDHRMGQVRCGVITSLSRGFQRRVDPDGFARFVVGSFLDPATAYVAYQRIAEIYWSSFRPSDCWFPYTIADDRVHRLSAAEITSHKYAISGELLLLRCSLTASLLGSTTNRKSASLLTLWQIRACPSGRMRLLLPRFLLGMALMLMYWTCIWTQKPTGTFQAFHYLA